MKKFIVCTIVLAVAIQSTWAQEMPERKREKIESRHHKDGLHRLHLTEDQKAKFKSLNEDYRKQMQDLKKNDEITVKEWKSRMEVLRKDHRDKMSALLTEDQKNQLKKSRQESHKRREDRREGGIDRMKTRLNLTDDQTTRLKESRSEMADKMKAIRENQSLTDDQKKVQFQELRKKQQENLKTILSEDQLKRLQEKQVRRPAKLPV
jgi:Spy/CpxP family protein refolding chaperone